MNYIGSKLTLLTFIEESIKNVTNNQYEVFCDLFAGTGVVSGYFKSQGYSVIANDIQYYSYVLARNYTGNYKRLKFAGLENELFGLMDCIDRDHFVCDYLSNIKGEKGFIYKHYSLGGTKNKDFERMYYTDYNAMQCDAVRLQIENWKKDNKVNEDEYFFLLASLIESIDKYANTASVYGAFLKKIKQSAEKNLVIKPAEFFANATGKKYEVFNEDVNTLIKKISCDVLYLDPPYNHRQYATNYHLLETIARYDWPEIYGMTGLRDYESQKSSYCSKAKVKESFKDLVLNANAKYIFLSYNNEGLMSLKAVKNIMSLRGTYGCFKKDYARFRSDKADRRNHKADKTVEYLHYVVCDK